MSTLTQLKKHLSEGHVYRRNDLIKWSKSVDRHLKALLDDGTLNKLRQGVYHFPKKSAFGNTPPEEQRLVRAFLKDDRFLLTSPNVYNSLGVGTTQLYNKRVVYNHKRSGEFKLGNRSFIFRIKPYFPKKATEEFLVVDLVNNLKDLDEDQEAIMKKLLHKIRTMNKPRLGRAVREYGGATAQRIFEPLLKYDNGRQDLSPRPSPAKVIL